MRKNDGMIEKLAKIVNWFIAVVFLTVGIVTFLKLPETGICFSLIGFLFLPPLRSYLFPITRIRLSFGARMILVIALLAVGGHFVQGTPYQKGSADKIRLMTLTQEATSIVKLAETGNAQAQLELGNIYFKGTRDIRVDYVRAARWFYESAMRGNIQAAFNLGLLYQVAAALHYEAPNFHAFENSTNMQESYFWLTLASTKGHQQAFELLVKTEKVTEDGSKVITPDNIVAIKDTVQKWGAIADNSPLLLPPLKIVQKEKEIYNSNWAEITQAAFDKKYEIVKSLIEGGADVNARRKDGTPLLMLASAHGQIEIVRLLIDNGADINIQSKSGSTALIWALVYDHPDIAKLLLERGADVTAQDYNTGRTALKEANTRYPSIAELIKKKTPH